MKSTSFDPKFWVPIVFAQQNQRYVKDRGEYREKVSETLKRKRAQYDQLDADGKRIMKLGFRFLNAAKIGDHQKLQSLLDEGAPVNFADPVTGATALHYTATYAARAAFRILLKSGQCDFLMRDGNGRLASEMAGVYGRDAAMMRLLVIKELKQARAAGVDPKDLYMPVIPRPAS